MIPAQRAATRKKLFPHFKFPDAVLFSDTVIIPQRISTGQLISKFAGNHGIPLSVGLVNEIWKTTFERKMAKSPLYIKGVTLTESSYKIWIEEAVRETLDFIPAFRSSRREKAVSDDIERGVYRALKDSRTYSPPGNIIKLLKKLRKYEIPYGIIANSSPHFPSIIHGVNSRLKDGLPLLVENGKLIPFVNAATEGIPKPDHSIFLQMLKQLDITSREWVYYIGNDPVLDYHPSQKLGLRSVLLTNSFRVPVSDTVYFSHHKWEEERNFRIADVKELDRAFFPPKKI